MDMLDMLEALPPSCSASSNSEYSSNDESDSVVGENHEDPSLEVNNQLEAEVEDPLIEGNQTQDSAVIHAREYQLEMFEESLKRNIIVAMETGTGKTQVAVLRIQAELEKSSPDKIIWVLAPTVALCEQHARVLRTQIPAIQIKFLSGADGVDAWTDVRTWDDYLRNVRIVVSTHQVLLDAISHAFVSLDRLSLIVFDEAHHCVGNHPSSKIMARYHSRKAAGLPVPSMLGLTASPIMKSKLEALELIEKSLDSVCKSPTIHREELLSIVKRPTMHYVFYSPHDYVTRTMTMESLARVYHNLDIYKDPYIIRLQADNTERSRIALIKALGKRDTYVFQQMRSLWRKSNEIQHELGSWAADYFISAIVDQFLRSVKKNDQWFREWQIEEKQYLAKALGDVKITRPPPFEDDATAIGISDKVSALVQELLHSVDNTIGIVFVKEIATVAVLAHMLSLHPSIKERFRIGTMIGTSNHTGRKRDLSTLNKTSGLQDLEDFQNGTLNLLIATSVLEEGIDVPACNMVVCFDLPDNLKAFIQRRGRARMRDSKLILMMTAPTSLVDKWATLEAEMKKRYEDDLREIQELAELEESEKGGTESLYVPETGAHLDFDQAKSHLEHFCRRLSVRQYIDSRPYYIFKRMHTSLTDFPKITATVVLPMTLPPELRRVESSSVWYSEKNASKDAAFQAYKAIYKAGLLNDNLLPLKDEFLSGVETRASEAEVRERWSPWEQVAQAWGHQAEFYQRRLKIVDQRGDIKCEFDASLPVPFPKIPDFEVFWDPSRTWRVEISEMKVLSAHDLHVDQSPALVDLAYRHRNFKVRDTAQVLHFRSPTQEILFQQLVGQKCIEEDSLNDNVIIRDGNGYPFFFKAWLPTLDPALPVKDMLRNQPVNVPWLLLEKWSRRKNFLRRVDKQPPPPTSKKPSQIIYPAHLCRMDDTHASNVCFGALIPSIMHVVETHLVATKLRDTLLKEVGYSDISLLITATNSPGTGEGTNYERIEFLGDAILKTFTTATITANYPHYPEGYLDAIKTSIVSNSRLCRSAIETGLDKFIFKKGFKGNKWRPLYVEDLIKVDGDNDNKRPMSTKTLADVVEALIGAAYLDGGLSKALTCIQIFIPEVEWRNLDASRDILFSQTPMSTELLAPLAPLEELIGYSFRNKNLLIEAATHSSFGLVNSTGSCMERLEFLGDSILDSVVVSVLWACERELDQREMHLFRTASVNADLLGFLGMEWTISQETTEISKDKTRSTIERETKIPFWKFMRHVSPEMGKAQHDTEERHALEREPILEALQHGKRYPWVELAHLHIPKFFSDLFESVLGAVWVDSGSMNTCAQVVERIGILPLLRRMLAENVDVLHPKNHLGILAGKSLKTVEYRNEVRVAEDGSRELFCKILVADEVLVELGGGVSPEQIRTKAAWEAYKILKARENEGNVKDEVMTG
ncbi:RNase3 domain-containing protein [Hypoxylon sp. EC38]|nr:RNase3 domain-containing protein [Hypoxylon sp. EC38]